MHGSRISSYLPGSTVEFRPHIVSTLARKLDLINAAVTYKDLRSPPANRYEELSAPLEGYSSIRVNSQYRLIFIWQNGKANNIYLDDHGYKWHK